MRKLRSQWTDSDVERLKALVASGASPHRAAVVLKRQVMSVQNKARAVGCPFPSMVAQRTKIRRLLGTRPFAITFTRIDGPTPPRTAVITARGVPANFGAGSARFFMG
jgi:hypothetical protein